MAITGIGQLVQAVLAGNSSYIIAATTGGLLDGIAYGRKDEALTGFVLDPRINVASDAARFIYQNDNLLRVPDQMFGYTIYGGPTISFLLPQKQAASPNRPVSRLCSAELRALYLSPAEKNRQQLANNPNGVRVICG